MRNQTDVLADVISLIADRVGERIKNPEERAAFFHQLKDFRREFDAISGGNYPLPTFKGVPIPLNVPAGSVVAVDLSGNVAVADNSGQPESD